MEIKKKRSSVPFWMFVIFLSSGSTDAVNYIAIKNLHNLTNNYLSFNAFYKVYVEEEYLNDRRKCDNCLMIAESHNYYDFLNITATEKCFGKFDSCVVDQTPETQKFLVGSEGSPSSDPKAIIYEVPGTCGTCVCYCYPNILHRDRRNYIDSICLDPISVDVSNKEVVIGLQFIQVKNMLMVQLKRGQIQNKVSITRGSSAWLPPPTECRKIVQLNHNHSYLLLDDSFLPDNHVVTGVSIRKCDHRWNFLGKRIRSMMNCEGNPFYLTVFGTNITSVLNGIDNHIVEGTLKGPKSLKERVDLTNDDMLPSEVARTNVLHESGHFVIKFRPTSWAQDKGKHVVPYLNSHPVEAKPSKPLGGVGVVYSGTESYGGFISPVLYAYRRQ